MDKLNLKKYFSKSGVIFSAVYLILLGTYWYFSTTDLYNVLLCNLLLIFACNIVYGAVNYKKRVMFLLFNVMIFMFLLSRPTIYMLRQSAWYNIFGPTTNITALNCILFSMVALLLGTVVAEKLFPRLRRKEKKARKKLPKIDLKVMGIITFVVMVGCLLCFGIKELDALLFMRGKAYEAYYSEYQPRVPYIINLVAGFYDFSVFAFLATKPNKKISYVVLGAYVLSGIPMLIVGLRNPFMLKAVFAFVYFVIRNRERLPKGKKWIGKIEKAMIIIAIPVVILGMGVMNYLRSGEAVDLNPSEIAVDFLFKQGTTYDTVLQGIAYEDWIPGEPRYFSFGPLYDNYVYGKLGNIVLGTDPDYIGSGNCFRSAYNSHSFAHAISYVVQGSSYLAGEGRGTSYVVENYVDFGYFGVFIISFLLGMFIAFLWNLFGRFWLLNTVILGVFASLPLMPRETTLYAFMDVLDYHFFVFIIGIVVLYGAVMLLKKKLKKQTD